MNRFDPAPRGNGRTQRSLLEPPRSVRSSGKAFAAVPPRLSPAGCSLCKTLAVTVFPSSNITEFYHRHKVFVKRTSEIILEKGKNYNVFTIRTGVRRIWRKSGFENEIRQFEGA